MIALTAYLAITGLVYLFGSLISAKLLASRRGDWSHVLALVFQLFMAGATGYFMVTRL